MTDPPGKEFHIMLTPKISLVACIGVVGAALLAGNANAMTTEECTHLDGNAYLAAIERGACGIDIVTAAGPQQEASTGDDDGGQGGRDGRNGGGKEGGDSHPGGGEQGGGRASPNKP